MTEISDEVQRLLRENSVDPAIELRNFLEEITGIDIATSIIEYAIKKAEGEV